MKVCTHLLQNPCHFHLLESPGHSLGQLHFQPYLYTGRTGNLSNNTAIRRQIHFPEHFFKDKVKVGKENLRNYDLYKSLVNGLFKMQHLRESCSNEKPENVDKKHKNSKLKNKFINYNKMYNLIAQFKISRKIRKFESCKLETNHKIQIVYQKWRNVTATAAGSVYNIQNLCHNTFTFTLVY